MPKFAEPIKLHDRLNPLLWRGQELRPEVRRALMKIADAFYRWLDVAAKPRDILLMGSQVNYTYTKYSDLDLHLVFDYREIDCEDSVEELFTAKRKLWKQEHNIDIYGIPVELYVEDLGSEPQSSIYSLAKRQWLRPPERSKVDYNRGETARLVAVWTRVIDHAVAAKNLALCLKIKNLIKKYRKLGLAQQGEFGVANLVFKSLRNSGAIGRLMNTITDIQDQKLSLE